MIVPGVRLCEIAISPGNYDSPVEIVKLVSHWARMLHRDFVVQVRGSNRHQVLYYFVHTPSWGNK